MDNISKPSLTRLARQAGVKSMSDDCFNQIRNISTDILDDLIKNILIVNTANNTKTIMSNDVYKALALSGFNVAQSTDVGICTITNK